MSKNKLENCYSLGTDLAQQGLVEAKKLNLVWFEQIFERIIADNIHQKNSTISKKVVDEIINGVESSYVKLQKLRDIVENKYD